MVALLTLPKLCAILRISASGSSARHPQFLAAGRRDRVEQRAQVLHVDQRQAVFVRDAERDVEDAFLDVVQVEQPRQQQRSHFGHGGAHRMALLAEDIPEHRRELIGLEFQAHLGGALEDEVLGLADFGNAGQVALDIRREHRNAGAGKALRHHLQRHGLAGAGRAGDEAMPIGERQRQPRRLFALADKDLLVGIGHLAVGGHHRIASSRIVKICRSPIISHIGRRLKPQAARTRARIRLRCSRFLFIFEPPRKNRERSAINLSETGVDPCIAATLARDLTNQMSR